MSGAHCWGRKVSNCRAGDFKPDRCGFGAADFSTKANADPACDRGDLASYPSKLCTVCQCVSPRLRMGGLTAPVLRQVGGNPRRTRRSPCPSRGSRQNGQSRRDLSGNHPDLEGQSRMIQHSATVRIPGTPTVRDSVPRLTERYNSSHLDGSQGCALSQYKLYCGGHSPLTIELSTGLGTVHGDKQRFCVSGGDLMTVSKGQREG
jgi:hypothetical protein